MNVTPLMGSLMNAHRKLDDFGFLLVIEGRLVSICQR